MTKFFNFIVVAAAIIVASQSASALPQIDPALVGFLNNPNESQRALPVILVFKDKMPINTRMSPVDRVNVQSAMMKNSEMSQADTVTVLKNLQKQGAKFEVKNFWLINSMGLYATQKVLKQVINSNDIIAVYSNKTLHIIAPVQASLSQPRGDLFTYGLTKLRLPEVWAKKKDLDGHGVKVGILDTGIDATHPDLKDRAIMFKDFVNHKNEPYDDHSHGTHVAGTISGGNASGTQIGIAPKVKLIIGKVFDKGGSGSLANILAAMQWIADPDGNPSTNDAPMLVSNSWGGGGPSSSMDPKDEPQCRAVTAWAKLGILPVFAAGNSGPSPSSVGLPGGCPDALAVGATDQQDGIANFSSRGAANWKTGSIIKPNVSAPGVAVFSSIPGGKYGTMSGTSMATPHTAGLASLVYQMMPTATVDVVAKALQGGAIDLGASGNDNTFGWGRIDALNTLKTIFTGVAR